MINAKEAAEQAKANRPIYEEELRLKQIEQDNINLNSIQESIQRAISRGQTSCSVDDKVWVNDVIKQKLVDLGYYVKTTKFSGIPFYEIYWGEEANIRKNAIVNKPEPIKKTWLERIFS